MTDNITQPLIVLPTKVRRTYRGGYLIERWHGETELGDSDRPEEWLASITKAINPGFPLIENEGLSEILLNGEKKLLREAIAAAPEELLGINHVKQYGQELGVLVKLIDSAERLSIQVHPDKPFAKRYFHSDYGKTECWHILETRWVNGQEPYLLIGFKPGVTKEYWQKLYAEQDVEAMLACLNKVIPRPGDTFLISGGQPHAIGPGCFLLEIQEPTDYTLRSERTMQDGTLIPEQLIHQGLGEELLMDCFHYEGMTGEQLDACCRVESQITSFSEAEYCTLLIGADTTPCFTMQQICCQRIQDFYPAGASILIVLEGRGEIRWKESSIPLKKGSQIFLPAGVRHFALCGEGGLNCIRCYPPGTVPDVPTCKQ